MTELIGSLPWVVLTTAFALALAESCLGTGVILPGELAVTGLAVFARGDTLALAVVVAAGAVAGDHVGYLLGRRVGPRLARPHLHSRRGRDPWEEAAAWTGRHGATAVVAGRQLPFLRTVVPAVVGCAGLTYRTFVVASVCGAVLWASTWSLVGTALSALAWLEPAVTVVTVVAVVGSAVAVVRWARGPGADSTSRDSVVGAR